jgi:hypothetical protein
LILPREVDRLRDYQAASAQHGNDLFATSSDDMAISHDTVGAVALDRQGNIAAATSTGGTLNKAPGRLGDSSLIGCGCYADNLSAAASTTGWGEPIMKLVLAKWTADRISAGNLPEWAAHASMVSSLRDGIHGAMLEVRTRSHQPAGVDVSRVRYQDRCCAGGEDLVGSALSVHHLHSMHAAVWISENHGCDLRSVPIGTSIPIYFSRR